MNKALESAFDKIRCLSEKEQAEVAELLNALADDDASARKLTETESAKVQIGLEQAHNREFASDAELQQFWDRNR